MKIVALALLGLCATGPALAQQPSASQQHEADKGIKTQNSGASGVVGEQEKPGSAAQVPGQPSQANTGGLANSPSAQNSGAGIAGAAGNKNGPSADKNTVGSSSPPISAKEQDPANVKGLPGNKSGPPAKR